MSEETMRLVMIEWLDAHQSDEKWTPLADATAHPMRCKSVGWLLHDGDTQTCVVANITDEKNEETEQLGNGYTIIPTAAILSIRTLIPWPPASASGAAAEETK